MTTAQIIELDGTQAVRLLGEFRFASATVSIRKDGHAVVLEPLKTTTWPPNFFEAIHLPILHSLGHRKAKCSPL